MFINSLDFFIRFSIVKLHFSNFLMYFYKKINNNMKYTEIKLLFQSSVSDDTKGIYIAELGDLGCDSFSEEGWQLLAYIQNGDFAKNSEEIKSYLSSIPNSKYEIKEMEDKNWNEVWESNFDPIVVNEMCAVRAPFHEPMDYPIELVIMPRMAFGTGHHQTTQLMIDEILQMDIKDKKGLDMGCGTGVLAIAALIKEASYIDAIDIDEWAYDNVMENATHNGVEKKISAYWGDASLLEKDGTLENEQYDFILANINRNILTRDMPIYLTHLKNGGEILFSGFLEDDITIMKNRGTELGLTFVKVNSKDKWHLLKFRK